MILAIISLMSGAVENCSTNEDTISLVVSTEFFEQSVKSASSYTKTVRSSSAFKKNLNQLATSASVSGSASVPGIGSFSASASASYEHLSESVTSSTKYEETIRSEKTEFNESFLQIIREVITRVTINGKSASITEKKFVDSVPVGKSLSSSQLNKMAEDYMGDRFGSTKTLRKTFSETICKKKTGHYIFPGSLIMTSVVKLIMVLLETYI